MTITVIVGKDRSGPGVTAKIFEPEQRYGVPVGPDLRTKIVTDWALLHGSVIPTSSNQMVYRISRHLLHADTVWTWVGCYGQAHFPNNARGGTYIGCGVLEAADMVDSDAALQYVLQVFQKLEAAKKPNTGILSASVFDFSESALGIEKTSLSAGEQYQPRSGLQPGKRKLFLDLHLIQDQALFSAGLCKFFWDAQRRPEYSEYSELVIGNNSPLADRAQESRAFDVSTPDAWQHLISSASGRRSHMPAQPEREEVGSDLLEKLPATPALKPQAQEAPANYEIAAMNDGLRKIQHDLHFVVRRLEDVDRKLERNVTPPEQPAQSARRWSPENWLHLVALSAVLLFGAASLFFLWEVRSVRSSSLVCESPAAVAFSSSNDAKDLVEAEVRCLEAEGDLLRARVVRLREALNVATADTRRRGH